MSAPNAPSTGKTAWPAVGRQSAFYREGEYWTIAYAGTVFRLRDAKGLHCLAHLLSHPGQKFAALELLVITDEAQALRPPSPHAVAAKQTESLPADSEEARVVVTKRIRSAVRKIAAHHPSLGHHLGTCIKTGTFCVYLPDPERPIVWTHTPGTLR